MEERTLREVIIYLTINYTVYFIVGKYIVLGQLTWRVQHKDRFEVGTFHFFYMPHIADVIYCTLRLPRGDLL